MENQLNERTAAYVGATAIYLFKGAGIFLISEIVILMLLGIHSSFGLGVSIYNMVLFLVIYPSFNIVQFGYEKLCDYHLDSTETILGKICVFGYFIEAILLIIAMIMYFM
jgi:hypothetical protein